MTEKRPREIKPPGITREDIHRASQYIMSLEDIECEAEKKVLKHFKGNKSKAALWFRTMNPILGNVSPKYMILVGRGKKLLRFIDTTMNGNLP